MNSFYNPPDKLSQLRREKEEAALEPAHVLVLAAKLPTLAPKPTPAPTPLAAKLPSPAAPKPVCKSYVKKITRCVRCSVITKGFLRCYNCNELHKFYNS